MTTLILIALFIAATFLIGLPTAAVAAIVAIAIVAAFGVGVVFGVKGWR